MFTLQTVCPYGPNDREGDEYIAEKDSRVVGNKFLTLHRLYKRPEYIYSKIEFYNKILLRSLAHISVIIPKMLAILFAFPLNLLKNLS